jgi:cell division transport system permease protein
VKGYLLSHWQAFQRALKRMRFQPGTTLLSVLVIGIALALPLGLHVLLDNAFAAAKRLNTEPQINVYLQSGATLEDAKALEARMRANPAVRTVRFIPREQALGEMKQVAGLAELIAGLQTNPLPHAFAIASRDTSPEAVDALRKDLAAMPKVDIVAADFEWARKLARFGRFAERLVLLLGLVLALAVVFVTGNTIRLQILTQHEELEVSQLIGATRRFIRRPFLYFGALQGLLAGAVALLLTLAAVAWTRAEVQALAISYLSDFSIITVSPQAAVATVFGASLLGWAGALVSVTLHLRRFTPS